MAKEKKNKETISITIDPDLLYTLKKHAFKLKKSYSNITEDAIRDFLEKKGIAIEPAPHEWAKTA